MKTKMDRLSMPAIERSFSESLPAHLYLDTDILIAYLVGTQPHHHRCRTFLERLVQHGLTRIYVSSLSWMEFTHALMRERFRRNLPDHQRRRLQLDRWHEPLVRRTYLQAFLIAFEDLLAQFAWEEISLTPEVRMTAIDYIGQYNLGPQDAVHLASATLAGIFDLASLDQGFRRVDGL